MKIQNERGENVRLDIQYRLIAWDEELFNKLRSHIEDIIDDGMLFSDSQYEVRDFIEITLGEVFDNKKHR